MADKNFCFDLEYSSFINLNLVMAPNTLLILLFMGKVQKAWKLYHAKESEFLEWLVKRNLESDRIEMLNFVART